MWAREIYGAELNYANLRAFIIALQRFDGMSNTVRLGGGLPFFDLPVPLIFSSIDAYPAQ